MESFDEKQVGMDDAAARRMIAAYRRALDRSTSIPGGLRSELKERLHLTRAYLDNQAYASKRI